MPKVHRDAHRIYCGMTQGDLDCQPLDPNSLRVAKPEWLESCHLKKLVLQTCVCICFNLCCHLRDVTFVTHVSPSWIKTISVKFNHNSAGIREGGSRIFWAFIACWELQMKASLRYPTLNYFEQNDAFIKMLSILDVNTYVYTILNMNMYIWPTHA